MYYNLYKYSCLLRLSVCTYFIKDIGKAKSRCVAGWYNYLGLYDKMYCSCLTNVHV